MFESIKSKVLKKSQLHLIRKKSNKEEKKIVFCTGCFDILQSGHAVFFNQCKKFGDILVVGIGRDSTIKALKGPSRPINPEINRLYLTAALEDVNYAVLNDTEITQGKIDFEEVISLLKPDVFVLNNDDSSINEKNELCQKYNVEMKLVPRIVPQELKPTSTTEIINKSKSQ
jgi:rfaE bifunctional protein nucleotidyltransferase chain/domain